MKVGPIDTGFPSPSVGNIFPAGVSEEVVLKSLARICKSGGGSTNPRLRKLLSYLVEETLRGRGDRIKSYSIALEVLGRSPDFDPQRDSIVRIEASKLRRELERYYLTEGRSDELVISVPKGAYTPSFEGNVGSHYLNGSAGDRHAIFRRGIRAVQSSNLGKLSSATLVVMLLATAVWWATYPRPPLIPPKPTLLFKPLVDLSNTPQTSLLAAGLSESIVQRLTRYRELAVIAGDPSPPGPSLAAARFELTGTFLMTDGGAIVQVHLLDRQSGQMIWAESYSPAVQAQELLKAESSIADAVAVNVAEPTGVIFDAVRSDSVEIAPADWSDFSCILNAYAYQLTLSASDHPTVRSCLQRTVQDYPSYATAWALLSLVYLDELRFSYGNPTPEQKTISLGKAYDAARRAVDLDPSNIRAQQALMMALFMRHDYQTALDLGQKARELNPNDLELKGELGMRLMLYGRHNEGCELISATLSSTIRKRPYYLTGLAVCRLFSGDKEEAARLIVDADAAGNPVFHIWAAIILSANGQTSEAAKHRLWLTENAPDKLTDLLEQLPLRFVQAADQQKVQQLIEQAGFPPPGLKGRTLPN